MRGMPDVFCIFASANLSRFAVRNPVEPVLEVSHQPFVPGTDAAVRLKFNNRGSAALDIETARVRAGELIEGGMASVELRAVSGLLLARKGFTQTTGGVQAAMLDSTLPGDGEVEKELTYYASIAAGSNFLFAPVMVPVPEAASGKLLLSAAVTRPAFDLSSAAVGGLGVFQALLEEAPVSSAAYTVSVAPGAAVYDQNSPVTLAGDSWAQQSSSCAGKVPSLRIDASSWDGVPSNRRPQPRLNNESPLKRCSAV